MPNISREMSWLSPKRRRTTGNLRKIPNGQVIVNNEDKVAPSLPSPTLQRSVSAYRPDSIPEEVVAGSSLSSASDGNLFYAYARKSDDGKSRYLLTFASAAIANEWWQLLQTHFPDVSRPGPQLFSFQTDDLLSAAWKHQSFTHLRSKWMYISFSDTADDIGGAAQGIIPVQDYEGNMLGGSSRGSDEWKAGVQKEAREVKREVVRLEEYFEQMMEAVAKNTQKVAQLSEKGVKQISNGEAASNSASGGGQVDMEALSNHFSSINGLLSRNCRNVEDLLKRHNDHEQDLRKTIEKLAFKQENDRLDMKQLSSHLDRIQHMMEASTLQRKDSAKEVAEQSRQIDFTPLNQRLEKVQEAIEANSALLRKLLDEEISRDSAESNPQLDLSPLTEHLQRIHGAIEQQSERADNARELSSKEVDLSPLTAHLERIHGAIEQQTQQTESVRENAGSTEVDLSPLTEHLERIHNAIEQQGEHADGARENAQHEVDLSPLTEHLERIHRAIEQQSESANTARENPNRDVNLSPLTEHLERIYGAIEQQSRYTQSAREIFESSEQIDLSPMTDHLERIHKAIEQQTQHNQSAREISERDKVVDLSPMTDHLERIHNAIEQQMENTKSREDSERNTQIDLSPLAERLEKIHDAIEQQRLHSESVRENSTTSPEVDLSPLAEHLERIHKAVEQQGEHTKALVTIASGEGDGGAIGTSQNGHLDPLGEQLEQIYHAIEEGNRLAKNPQPPQIDLKPLHSQFDSLRIVSQKSTELMEELLAAQNATREATEANGELDFTPLVEHLEAIRDSSQQNNESIRSLIDTQVATPQREIDFTPMTSHLESIRTATESLLQSQRSMADQSDNKAPFDMTPVTERLTRIHSLLERQAEPRDQSPGTGDAKFVMNALTSHLSKIQGVTEQNATHVKLLREKQTATQNKMAASLLETSQQIRDILARNNENEARIDAANSQMRELMSGQREMVDVMRQLGKSIVAQNKGACDHVVVPPPRKMSKKVVGFVYDAKEGIP